MLSRLTLIKEAPSNRKERFVGYIDFEDPDERRHVKRIKAALRRRGLVPDETCEWEVHGPHPGMNYQVYVGEAANFNRPGWQQRWCVAIYPWAVYEINEPSEWGADPERRIRVKQERRT